MNRLDLEDDRRAPLPERPEEDEGDPELDALLREAVAEWQPSDAEIEEAARFNAALDLGLIDDDVE